MHGLFYYILCLMPFISIWEDTKADSHYNDSLFQGGGKM